MAENETTTKKYIFDIPKGKVDAAYVKTVLLAMNCQLADSILLKTIEAVALVAEKGGTITLSDLEKVSGKPKGSFENCDNLKEVYNK